LHAVSQDGTGLLCRAALKMRFSVLDQSRKWWNWFKSKHILLLSTWQNNYIFLTTHFNQICRKTLQSAYKNNETEIHWILHHKNQNYFTEFFNTPKNGLFLITKQTTIF
jgi:hypothetical protein